MQAQRQQQDKAFLPQLSRPVPFQRITGATALSFSFSVRGLTSLMMVSPSASTTNPNIILNISSTLSDARATGGWNVRWEVVWDRLKVKSDWDG